VGERTLAMGRNVWSIRLLRCWPAAAALPLFLTDGLKDYSTALLTHDWQWVEPPRAKPWPAPKPRGCRCPQLLYAQVVKKYRRRRVVRVRHRVVFGTLAGVNRVLATTGWQDQHGVH